MLTSRGVRALRGALIACCGVAFAVGADAPSQERIGAADEIARRITGCPTPIECANATARIAVHEKKGSPVQLEARRLTVKELNRAKDALFLAFSGAKPEVQAEILEIFDEGWENMHHGVDYEFLGLVRDALDSPHRVVRRSAAALMANHQVWGVAHTAIDAAEDDPTLTLPALFAIENCRAAVASRWVIGQLTNREPAIRQQAQRTLVAIGPIASQRLKERLDDPDPAMRRAVMDAFLLVVTADDVPLLQTWLENHAAQDSELAERVTKALAETEAGRYQPKTPDRPTATW